MKNNKVKFQLYLFIITFIILLYTSNFSLAQQNFAAVVIDSETGKIFYSKNISSKIYPASLTKMMTLYIVFDQINSGKLNWNQKLRISKNAASKVPSKLGLITGEYITVKDAVLSIITKSANDTSAVIAEAISKTEKNFAKLMTTYAQKLGMNNTVFQNATGLHHKDHFSTALDMAVLAMNLKRHFPKYYELFSIREFTYKDRQIMNSNKIISIYSGADGLKTGFTSIAGYNLASSAAKNNKKIIAVVIGASNSDERYKKSAELLDIGMSKLQSHNITQLSLNKRKPRNLMNTLTVAENITRIASTAAN
jgi:D-alanyl-D-alanine carboxypeptidase